MCEHRWEGIAGLVAFRKAGYLTAKRGIGPSTCSDLARPKSARVQSDDLAGGFEERRRRHCLAVANSVPSSS